MVAGDLDPPDWCLEPDGEGEEAAKAARDVLADDLAERAVEVGVISEALRRQWVTAAQRTVAWRERREAGRGMMRLCMRAWREVVDGLPAGASAFDQRWRRADDCELARKLHISDAALLRWGEEEWMPVRFVLAWMRLVRAGRVHRRRQRNPEWRAARELWRRQRYYSNLHTQVEPEAAGRDARADSRPQHRTEWLQGQQQKKQRREEQREQQWRESQASAPPRVLSGDVPAASSGAAGPVGEPRCQPCEEERSSQADDSGDEGGSSSDDDGEAGGGDSPFCGPQGWFWDFGDHQPRRSRRNDASLALHTRALDDLRRHLADGGGQTRLAHARRARGDG